jgi:WD40 repeat protein
MTARQKGRRIISTNSYVEHLRAKKLVKAPGRLLSIDLKLEFQEQAATLFVFKLLVVCCKVCCVASLVCCTMATPISTSLALGDDGEDHPRRLLEIGKHLVAYGGDHGTISVLEQTGNADGKIAAKVTRRFDDSVRAVAVSHDLLRVAVGFDDGSTKIFAYDDTSLKSNENGLHPFLTAETQVDDASQDFLSQSDGLTTTNPSSASEESFLGPRFDAPVRHMQFDPRSYHLAIAAEAGMCIVDVTTSKSLETRFLQENVEKEHDSCGIRGVSYGRAHSNKMLLATLAMDGRLCIWDVTAPTNDPLLDYELLLRDANKCVTQADVGEINGASAFDRSCLPVFGKDFLALPGLTDVQLRRFESLKEQLFLSSVGDQGHTDTIVAMTFSPDGCHLVTSGRDGRVILWELDPSNVSVVFLLTFAVALLANGTTD